MKHTNETAALHLMTTAISFLAVKHGVTEQAIADALQTNEKIIGQFAELVEAGIVAWVA